VPIQSKKSSEATATGKKASRACGFNAEKALSGIEHLLVSSRHCPCLAPSEERSYLRIALSRSPSWCSHAELNAYYAYNELNNAVAPDFVTSTGQSGASGQYSTIATYAYYAYLFGYYGYYYCYYDYIYNYNNYSLYGIEYYPLYAFIYTYYTYETYSNSRRRQAPLGLETRLIGEEEKGGR
jgi:hypothetical protein